MSTNKWNSCIIQKSNMFLKLKTHYQFCQKCRK